MIGRAQLKSRQRISPLRVEELEADRLRTNLLVRSMLKAIGIGQTAKASPVKSICIMQILIESLKNHHSEKDSIFQVARYEAVLLLLASEQ